MCNFNFSPRSRSKGAMLVHQSYPAEGYGPYPEASQPLVASKVQRDASCCSRCKKWTWWLKFDIVTPGIIQVIYAKCFHMKSYENILKFCDLDINFNLFSLCILYPGQLGRNLRRITSARLHHNDLDIIIVESHDFHYSFDELLYSTVFALILEGDAWNWNLIRCFWECSSKVILSRNGLVDHQVAD